MSRHHDLGGENLGRVGGMEVHGNGLLGEVGVLTSLVDLELGGHLAAELGLGKHALDGLLNDRFGATGEKLDEGLFAKTTGESGVAAIELLVRLEAGEHDLFGIDDHDVIAHIDVGGVERVGLAREDGGGLCGEAAEGLTARIEQVPLALDIFATRNGGGHRLGYSLFLPSSVFGLVHEESGAVDGSLIGKTEKPERTFVPGQGDVREGRNALQTRGTSRLNWTTHKPMGWVLQGRLC